MLEDCKYRELLEENRKLKESVIHLREYDPVTNLYNREAFCASAERTIRQTPQTRFEIICIDIERFKLINELYGREQGDLLLKYVAEQLKCLVREETHIAGNLRDDVFALCIPAYEEEVTVERILRIFSDKPLNSQAVPAVGVYRMDAEEPAAGSMCDRALMALNSIKGNDHHVAVYREGMRENLLREQEITNSMAAGIQNKEFKIYMQPKCNMETGKVVGAEVLVRWQHPEKGLLLPGEFVPLFEKNHFIEKLDLYVWEETAAWVRRWLDRGRACVPVSVNLSRMDIFNMDVCSVLTDLMERYQIPTGLIELEITESVYAGQPERIIKETERLKWLFFPEYAEQHQYRHFENGHAFYGRGGAEKSGNPGCHLTYEQVAESSGDRRGRQQGTACENTAQCGLCLRTGLLLLPSHEHGRI